MEKQKPEFKVEIMRPGQFGVSTSAELELPATWAEYHDALEKARITDDRTIYSATMLSCQREWLVPHIPEQLPGGRTLLELNLLATRMQQYIPENLDIMEAMVKIEAGRTENEPILIPRLINLTFNTDRCHIAPDNLSDTNLGKFLYENDFLQDADYNAVLSRVENGQPVSELLTLLGREHREANGGTLTGTGLYVEFDGELEEVYKPGEMVYFQRTGVPVVLELSKNGKTATLDLPARSGTEIYKALDAVVAAELEECKCRCIDCLIPAAKSWIDKVEDVEQILDFAHELGCMDRLDRVTGYKAILEAAKCEDLQGAMRLAEVMEDYRLDTEYATPEDYAKAMLNSPPFSEFCLELDKYIDLYTFGSALMEKNNVVMTEYGTLSRKDGGQLFSQSDEPEPGMGMEMS
jgi:hypothetical protein